MFDLGMPRLLQQFALQDLADTFCGIEFYMVLIKIASRDSYRDAFYGLLLFNIEFRLKR